MSVDLLFVKRAGRRPLAPARRPPCERDPYAVRRRARAVVDEVRRSGFG